MAAFKLKIPDKQVILQNGELIWNLVVVDLKIRYKNSKFGFLWSLINPLFMTVIFLLVFTVIMKFRTKDYSMLLLLGIILWRFFSESTSSALPSLVRKGTLIRKMYFPREVLVMSIVTSAFISTILELSVFFIIFLLLGAKLSISFLLFPAILLAEFILVLGVSLLISSFYVFFRDYNDIWKLTVKAGFYLTPVIWPITVLGKDSAYLPYIMVNPMARIVMMSRTLLINGKLPPVQDFFILFVMCAAVYLFGYITFKKYESRFAREV